MSLTGLDIALNKSVFDVKGKPLTSNTNILDKQKIIYLSPVSDMWNFELDRCHGAMIKPYVLWAVDFK